MQRVFENIRRIVPVQYRAFNNYLRDCDCGVHLENICGIVPVPVACMSARLKKANT